MNIVQCPKFLAYIIDHIAKENLWFLTWAQRMTRSSIVSILPVERFTLEELIRSLNDPHTILIKLEPIEVEPEQEDPYGNPDDGTAGKKLW